MNAEDTADHTVDFDALSQRVGQAALGAARRLDGGSTWGESIEQPANFLAYPRKLRLSGVKRGGYNFAFGNHGTRARVALDHSPTDGSLRAPESDDSHCTHPASSI